MFFVKCGPKLLYIKKHRKILIFSFNVSSEYTTPNFVHLSVVRESLCRYKML